MHDESVVNCIMCNYGMDVMCGYLATSCYILNIQNIKPLNSIWAIDTILHRSLFLTENKFALSSRGSAMENDIYIFFQFLVH